MVIVCGGCIYIYIYIYTQHIYIYSHIYAHLKRCTNLIGQTNCVASAPSFKRNGFSLWNEQHAEALSSWAIYEMSHNECDVYIGVFFRYTQVSWPPTQSVCRMKISFICLYTFHSQRNIHAPDVVGGKWVEQIRELLKKIIKLFCQHIVYSSNVIVFLWVK